MNKTKITAVMRLTLTAALDWLKSPFSDLILTQINENVHSFVENNVQGYKKA